MVNLFGSSGDRGSVIKITARGRKGEEGSFTECIQKSLAAAYGNDRTISLGGVFISKSSKVRYHIMPDFPSAEQLPFKDRSEVARWLRSNAGFVVARPWYVDEMWPELFELRRKARGLMGLWRPSRSMRDLVIEAATSGGTLEEMREVARARRAEG